MYLEVKKLLFLKNKIHVLWLVVFLFSCAAQQVQLKSSLIPSKDTSPKYVLEENVTIKAPNAAATTLKAGTSWLIVGELDEGIVYRTKDQVVIVNSFNVHEGFIVIKNDNVVGYYL